MAILEILGAAQNGAFFVNAGKAAGLSEADARAAIAALAPAIAEKLKDKAAADPAAFDQLLDLLEDGGDSSDLDDPDAITGAEAQADGAAILNDLYGASGVATLGHLAPATSGAALEKISAISATSVLAALAARNASTLAGDAAQVADSGGGGIFSVIIAALMKGLMQGALRGAGIRQRPRRRRTSYGYGTQRPRRKRRTRRPGLDTIFKDILGGRR